MNIMNSACWKVIGSGGSAVVHRFARCKGCHAEALNVRDLYRKRHEKPLRGAESQKLKAESKDRPLNGAFDFTFYTKKAR